MEIRSKSAYYQLMELGCLGNTLRNWRTKEEALASPVQTFGLREIGAAGGGKHVVVSRERLPEEVWGWSYQRRNFLIDEAAPDEDVLLQGEICQTHRGWEGLLGVRTGHRMRESSRLGLLRPYIGLTVRALLDQFVDPSTRDDIDGLFDLYPDAAIELASYPYKLGKLPNRNTVIWEVRNY